MSEAWGADIIPGFGRPDLVEALSVARQLPDEAIDEAARRPEAIAAAVIDVVRRAAHGEPLGIRSSYLLLWGIHALAQARWTALCQPLLALLRRPYDELEPHLVDTSTATLPRIVASVFDGDRDALEAAITDQAIDEFARWSLFGAYTFLVFDGRLDGEDAKRFLVRFDDGRLARGGDSAWRGWEDAVALLGHTDLAERVAAARADARLLTEEGDEEAFAEQLAAAVARPADAGRFADSFLSYLDDAVTALDQMLRVYESVTPADEPAVNPLRHVGRNDPCPCGSGRKYKKCCLAAA